MFLALPRVATGLQQGSCLSSAKIDLLVIRFSLLMLALGNLLIAEAGQIWLLIFGEQTCLSQDLQLCRSAHLTTLGFCIFSIGNGIRAPLLATSSQYNHDSDLINRLYTFLSLTDSFSHMLAAPLIPSIWAKGLELGGSWLVLPFLVTSVRI